jgi:tetratricopeptide (TPR) repeat protein
MTNARKLAIILLSLAIPVAVWAQAKGNGRINGKILDDQGKPAQNVMIRAQRAGDPLFLEARTNDKGEWQIQNMAGGKWTFEFMKEGFELQRMEVAVADNNRNPPIDMKLTKAAPAVDPNVEIQGEMNKAIALQKEGKQADARKIIETLLVKYPIAHRLNAFVATTYEAEKNYDKAIEHLKLVVDKEPADLEMKTYLAELYTAKGDKVEAQKVLEAIDMTKVTDPTLFLNMAIGSINAGRADEAIATLDKVNKAFPTRADVFYYRARAYIVGKKMVEAKADLEKFVAMAPPDARELADAKKLLEQLKDVK